MVGSPEGCPKVSAYAWQAAHIDCNQCMEARTCAERAASLRSGMACCIGLCPTLRIYCPQARTALPGPQGAQAVDLAQTEAVPGEPRHFPVTRRTLMPLDRGVPRQYQGI